MKKKFSNIEFLPTTVKEVNARGWDEVDVILISGDAYVDHPSFGTAIIARLLESMGIRVAVVPQPNWQDDLRDFKKFGAPNLFFGVTSGAMDSMVSNYTAGKRRRSDDAYTPGNKAGFRPDYALSVYSNICKELYPDTPVILGGLEASLRRITHYDYWSDSLMPSVLADSNADMLVYGMGEQPIREIVRLLQKGVPVDSQSFKTIPQTAFFSTEASVPKNKNWQNITLQSHESCKSEKLSFLENNKLVAQAAMGTSSKRLIQDYGNNALVINPPFEAMTSTSLDSIYNLPFTRIPHPRYNKKGPISAYEMIRHSISLHRGCFGGCSFCAISLHQGRNIISRSFPSVLKEVKDVSEMADFTGTISDLGGPTANMYLMGGIDVEKCGHCNRTSCLYPSICNNLNYNHRSLIDLYKQAGEIAGIKKICISSGVRYDMLVGIPKEQKKKYNCSEYLKILIQNHVSGRLKVAPEHSEDSVLALMKKPSFSLFRKFQKQFMELSKEVGLEQYIVPYFIAAHPGSTKRDMALLACKSKELGYKLAQVQEFTPTPMTLSATMYYIGLNPDSGENIFCAKKSKDKSEQLRYLFWYKPENKSWFSNALKKIGLNDPAIK